MKIKTVVHWVMTLCSPVCGYKLSEEHAASTFYHEDGGSIFLRNFGNHLPNYTES
jgi:hypothetical protein